jgi:hypothetical protein
MRKHNGKQLYGIQKILTTLKMGMNKELRKLPIKQKLAMNYVSKERLKCPNATDVPKSSKVPC